MAALKPGGLGSQADAASKPSAFANSMADLMEQELNALLVGEGRPALIMDNSTESRDRRLLFVAIARGVVRHLDAEADAFEVEGIDPVVGTPSVDIHVDL
jgi:hypothetical protein